MGEFLRSLRESPAALTRAQKILFAVFAVVIALTRFPALSLTLHDWDETLFASAVHEYDVKPHHPHPPGYPLFIVAAKLARLFTDSDFHATQTVATLASMLIFPAAFLLARELRFRTRYAFGAAALTAFMPSLWYYGGTGFSDVPALMLILFASALLLRGGRSPRAYFAGALFTALACGIRPHLLMIAAAPALLGMLALRRMKTVVAAWLAAAAVVFLTYLGAAFFSSDFPYGYVEQVRYIEKHIRQSDSYHNPYRTPLGELAPRVFLFPCGGGRMKIVLVVLAVIALVDAAFRRRMSVAVVLAMFLPIAVFTWFMLDMTALSRYAIAYLPMQAFLAIAGADAIAQLVPSKARVPLFIVLSGFVTFSLIKWTWPALRFARTEPSPVVAAFQWIRTNVPKDGPRVYVQGGLVYHAMYFIPDYDYQLVFDERILHDDDYAAGNVYVFEGETQHPEPRWFKRKRLQLWEVTRPRFFEIGIVSMHKVIRWGRGWHLPETDGQNRWRWMRRESQTFFSPALYGRGELHLKLHAPVDVTPRPPVITVMWNGAVIDRRTAPPDGDFDLRYTLPSRNEGRNELRLATDETIQPKDDGRELGLSLHGISWGEPAAATGLQ
jgi:4-amino-4-deoxy-L-arabinose transferase-like glycosyltransferase